MLAPWSPLLAGTGLLPFLCPGRSILKWSEYLIFSKCSTLIKREPKPVPGGAAKVSLVGYSSAQTYTEIICLIGNQPALVFLDQNCSTVDWYLSQGRCKSEMLLNTIIFKINKQKQHKNPHLILLLIAVLCPCAITHTSHKLSDFFKACIILSLRYQKCACP